SAPGRRHSRSLQNTAWGCCQGRSARQQRKGPAGYPPLAVLKIDRKKKCSCLYRCAGDTPGRAEIQACRKTAVRTPLVRTDAATRLKRLRIRYIETRLGKSGRVNDLRRHWCAFIDTDRVHGNIVAC